MLSRPPKRTAAAAHKRRLNRERVRRYTARRETGLACYQVEVSGAVIDMLVRLGWLADTAATDPRQVSKAISALLSDTAKNIS